MVNYDAGGSAVGGADYVALAGSVTIPAGAASATIAVDVLDDNVIELPETVLVTLTAVSHPAVTISSTANQAEVAIADDDATTVSLAASAADGSEPGLDDGEFTVTLDGGKLAPPGGISVTYTILGTATPGVDYLALTGTTTIPAGQASVAIPVAVLDDPLVEAAETVILTLTGTDHPAVTVSVSNPTATVTIADDDAAVVGLSGPQPTDEGDAGTKLLEFTVTLSGPVEVPVSIHYATADGTAQDENGDGDYQSAGGTLTFLPGGDLTQTITVAVNGDTVLEPDETFQVVLSNLQAGTPARNVSLGDAAATATIVDDDAARLTIIVTQDAAEDATDGLFTVTTDKLLSQPIEVSLSISGTATAGVDYEAIGTVLTFPANTTSVTIPVAVLPDDMIEGDGNRRRADHRNKRSRGPAGHARLGDADDCRRRSDHRFDRGRRRHGRRTGRRIREASWSRWAAARSRRPGHHGQLCGRLAAAWRERITPRCRVPSRSRRGSPRR